MRIWSIHPRYLDARGLVALWREALLARAVHAEAGRRGYSFNSSKIGNGSARVFIPVTTGQIALEWKHLLRKLAVRSPGLCPQRTCTSQRGAVKCRRSGAGTRPPGQRPSAPFLRFNPRARHPCLHHA